LQSGTPEVPTRYGRHAAIFVDASVDLLARRTQQQPRRKRWPDLALIQLRTYWRAGASRRAWIAASLGMALLAVEGDIGSLFALEAHDPGEMGMSIAMWIAAARLRFRGARRSSVMLIMAFRIPPA
jgi:hypothetical protein